MPGPTDIKFTKELRLRQALKRFESYLEAGMAKEVSRVLTAKSISAATIRNWMGNPKKILTSYRWTEFADAMETLSDLDQKRRNEAYGFALKELDVEVSGQRDLIKYHGNYRIIHDFSGIQLNYFIISVEESPFVVIFVFKYSNSDGRRGKCDGLIVQRHGRFVCAGFSPTTVFIAVFYCVGFPEKDLIRGIAFIDDLNSKEVQFSRIAITRDLNAASSKEAQEYVKDSGKTL